VGIASAQHIVRVDPLESAPQICKLPVGGVQREEDDPYARSEQVQ